MQSRSEPYCVLSHPTKNSGTGSGTARGRASLRALVSQNSSSSASSAFFAICRLRTLPVPLRKGGIPCPNPTQTNHLSSVTAAVAAASAARSLSGSRFSASCSRNAASSISARSRRTSPAI